MKARISAVAALLRSIVAVWASCHGSISASADATSVYKAEPSPLLFIKTIAIGGDPVKMDGQRPRFDGVFGFIGHSWVHQWQPKIHMLARTDNPKISTGHRWAWSPRAWGRYVSIECNRNVIRWRGAKIFENNLKDRIGTVCPQVDDMPKLIVQVRAQFSSGTFRCDESSVCGGVGRSSCVHDGSDQPKNTDPTDYHSRPKLNLRYAGLVGGSFCRAPILAHFVLVIAIGLLAIYCFYRGLQRLLPRFGNSRFFAKGLLLIFSGIFYGWICVLAVFQTALCLAHQ